jgi:hypothetical protein
MIHRGREMYRVISVVEENVSKGKRFNLPNGAAAGL